MQTLVIADAQFRDGKNGTFLQIKDAEGNLYFVFDTHLHNDLVAAVGQSITVEVEQRERGRRITAVQSPAQTTYMPKPPIYDKERLIVREVALKAAVEARISTEVDDVLRLADRFVAWLLEGEAPF